MNNCFWWENEPYGDWVPEKYREWFQMFSDEIVFRKKTPEETVEMIHQLFEVVEKEPASL